MNKFIFTTILFLLLSFPLVLGNEYVIRLNDITPVNLENLTNLGVNIHKEYNNINALKVEIPEQAMNDLMNKPFIHSIEPNYKINSLLDTSLAQINHTEIYNLYGFNGSGVNIAVMDTGINNHTFLSIAGRVDFTGEGIYDDNGHGTFVSGIIGSNDSFYRGVAYASNIYSIKVLDSYGDGHGTDLLDGIEWALNNNIDILSMSLGAEMENCDGTDFISVAVDDAVSQGLVVVVSAGNDGPNSSSITSPACSFNSISVGSVNSDNNIASFSSRGPTSDGRVKPDIVSPGVGIISTGLNNDFVSGSGTSASAPFVSGVVALLLQHNPSYTPSEIKDLLMNNAYDLGFLENEQGSGLLDVQNTFSMLQTFSFESLSISPELDFAYFGDYVVSANISGAGSVVMNVSGINGEGVYCWDYYVDGSCASENNIISMNHDGSLWNGFIYPDYIYPEVHFVSSDVTWYNEPVSVGVHRNNFHLFNFSNPFSMVSNTTLWLEFNAVPTNANSHLLEVYLVSKDAGDDYFSGDWRSGEYTSLVSSLDRNTELHHTHSEFSSHHVVGLSTDELGLVNGLNLSDSFWLVLYNHMNQASRGWDLRYHDINNCDSYNAWFTSSGSGLNFYSGCPDVHFHISRRNEAIMDGANVSLNIDGEVNNVSEIFYFGEMSSVYPNPTSFITPQDEEFVNGVVNVSWLPSSVPNDDDIEYSVILSNETDYIETFITTEDVFSFDWNTSVYDDGDYELMLYYCADPRGSNLCSNSTITVFLRNNLHLSGPSSSSLFYGDNLTEYFYSDTNNFTLNDTSIFSINSSGFLTLNNFLDVGDYLVNISVSDEINVEYIIFNLSIIPTPLNISVYNYEKFVGDSDPFFEYNISGFVLDENLSYLNGSLIVEREPGEVIGVYEIFAHNVTSNNYNISFFDGNLTILEKLTTPSGGDRVLIKKTDSFSITGEVTDTKSYSLFLYLILFFSLMLFLIIVKKRK